MSKRTPGFERRAMDAYDTPEAGVLPLLPFIQDVRSYAEPCAGNGYLIRALKKHGLNCVWASDIRTDVKPPIKGGLDALSLTRPMIDRADAVISNPPWTRGIMMPMIKHLMRLKPTWMLFDSDFMHNQQAASLIIHCRAIISVGRLRWIEGTEHASLDNCCWYLFDGRHIGQPVFHPRMV